MFMGTYVQYETCECVRDDIRHTNDVMHHLLACAFDVFMFDDMKYACHYLLSLMSDEIVDACGKFDASLMEIERINTPLTSSNALTFLVKYDHCEYAQILFRKIGLTGD